jgi:hypothetical protein
MRDDLFAWGFLVALVLLLRARHTSGSSYVNVDAPERYASLLLTETYITPTGQHVTDPSLFVGIFYTAVVPNPLLLGGYELEITGVHQIAFATLVALKGPAAYGKVSPNSTLNAPIYVIATGAAAASTNSPFQATVPLTSAVLGYLREGLLYYEVTSGGRTSGQIRGQITPETDLLVNFISSEVFGYKADEGMALIQLVDVKSQPASYALRYWIVSTIPTGTWVAFSTALLQLTTFGPVLPSSIYLNAVVTPFSPLVTVPRADTVVCTPNATYSTNLLLGLLVPFETAYFQRFVQTRVFAPPAHG